MDNRLPDVVFTVREIARAAGVTEQAVTALLETGAVRVLPLGGRRLYLDRDEAIRAGRALALGLAVPDLEEPGAGHEFRPLFQLPSRAGRSQAPFAISSAVHAGFLLALAAASVGIGAASPEAAAVPRSDTRLVYVTLAGPGGGGGGGGAQRALPARAARSRGNRPLRSPLPARPLPAPSVQRASTPPPQPIDAPVVPVPADEEDAAGVIDEAPEDELESEGPGDDGSAGAGAGGGIGDGTGDGLGEGEGGGTGGGPFRPGSGIAPPSVVREVKPVYTEAARLRGLQGEVLLEIVVRRDGSVGDVRVVQGLGYGLDERAGEAVRQWRFRPATRYGTPVDVLVEVAMEFRLR